MMNYRGDDYVLGHLLRAARESGRNQLRVDFITGMAEPAELLTSPVAASVQSYVAWFPKSVEAQGAAMKFIAEAKLVITFDLLNTRPNTAFPNILESPYVCDVELLDERGRKFSTHLNGWWYPEPTEFELRSPTGRPMTTHFALKCRPRQDS